MGGCYDRSKSMVSDDEGWRRCPPLSLHFTKMGLTADQLIYGVIRVLQ